jgi:3-oxoacyl-[acyl-carrier protein] reductase
MYTLQGHVALVTGASQGIGRACAKVLAANGASVALAARSEDKLKSVLEEIVGAGGKAAAFKLDVSSEEAIKATVKEIQAQLGKIDILVNNAGITKDTLMMRMKRADWDDVMATNLTAPFLLTKECIPGMLKLRWGRIINITSINGQMGAPGQANYASSKAGLIGLTLSAARELASRNITVNAVAPGWIETAMTSDLAPELKDAMIKQVPLGRAGSDVDIAHAVNFLASEEASYITGHVLNVNGGMLMG